jgi:hypothetical protein
MGRAAELQGFFEPWQPACNEGSAMTPHCHISERLKASCDNCGAWPTRLHMPEEKHGWYCPRCCPVCNPRPVVVEPVQPQPEAGAA